ncbi:MAG: 5-oxoprolinase subunit PxpA [Acidobacteriaceae bacterium]
MSDITIDLNADLGEYPDAFDSDVELMRYISSANIACGGHAGDEQSVRRTIEIARKCGVAVGAHPSFPDRANFGRVAMRIPPAELEKALLEQLQMILSVAQASGVRVTHVKPHGALYHAANSDPVIAGVIAAAIAATDAKIIVVAQFGSPAVSAYQRAGLGAATEAFADRAYEPDGRLRARSLAGALLKPADAVAQAVNIVVNGYAVASDGTHLNMNPDTLCFHSDTPGAPEIARLVRAALERTGVLVACLLR